MKNLYKNVNKQLLKSHDKPPVGHALKRMNNLSGFITGMIRKGSSHLSDIGYGLLKNIDANSKTIAAKRFVANKWTDVETQYLPYLEAFLKGFIMYALLATGEIILTIDGSQMGKHNAALMVSLVWRKRGIPLCWLVKSGSKGHFKEEHHVEVLKQALLILLPLLPADTPVTILGDGEFDGINLQKLCRAYGCKYALRTACNTVFYKDEERFKGKSLSVAQDHDCLFIEHVEFTDKRYKYVNFLCWHDYKRHQDPIFLVSNICCPRAIMEYYDQRYSIECLFKDMKSTSFNVHKTRLKKPEEVNNLLIIAALAFILLTTLAHIYDKVEYRKKVQRVRIGKKVLSFFSFAYKLVEYFLDYDVGFTFSFQFSKFSKNSS